MSAWENARRVLEHYPQHQSLSWRALGNAGGFSGASLWRGDGSGDSFLLRCWPSPHPSARRLEFIHQVLQFAAERGCNFICAPSPTSNGQTFVAHAGRLWQIERWYSSAADFVQAPNAAKAANACEALASFHLALQQWPHRPVAPPPAVSERLERLQEADRFRDWAGAVGAAPNELQFVASEARDYAQRLPALLDPLRRRLQQLEKPASLQPSIRDIWTDHVFFDGDEVIGIVDFGALRLDWPLVDIARLLGSLDVAGEAYFELGLEAYCRRLGCPLEQVAAAVRTLDDASRVITPMSWISWLLFEGRQFEDMERVRERFSVAMSRFRQFADNPAKSDPTK